MTKIDVEIPMKQIEVLIPNGLAPSEVVSILCEAYHLKTSQISFKRGWTMVVISVPDLPKEKEDTRPECYFAALRGAETFKKLFRRYHAADINKYLEGNDE
jgi:hypothetical protein